QNVRRDAVEKIAAEQNVLADAARVEAAIAVILLAREDVQVEPAQRMQRHLSPASDTGHGLQVPAISIESLRVPVTERGHVVPVVEESRELQPLPRIEKPVERKQ